MWGRGPSKVAVSPNAFWPLATGHAEKASSAAGLWASGPASLSLLLWLPAAGALQALLLARPASQPCVNLMTELWTPSSWLTENSLDVPCSVGEALLLGRGAEGGEAGGCHMACEKECGLHSQPVGRHRVSSRALTWSDLSFRTITVNGQEPHWAVRGSEVQDDEDHNLDSVLANPSPWCRGAQ